MNNVHDMGGQQGYGPIEIETDEPVFHSEWEARALAITLAMGAWGRWNIDASRHARERLAPLEYLRFSYYERWLAGLADLMVERGLVTLEELERGHPVPGTERATPALGAEQVPGVLRAGGPSSRPLDIPPRFPIGAQVWTSHDCPPGHTRLPAYARGRRGEVVLHHGGHVLPDSNAHFRGESPQHLYAVRFAARELWGPRAAPQDSVTLDLWESYLAPA